MSVLTRSTLDESPLADLHVLASELGIDGYRRLRKADLIGAIIERQGGDPSAGGAPADDVGDAATDDADAASGDDAAEEKPASRRRSRGGRSRSRSTRDADAGDDPAASDVETEAEADAARAAKAARPARGRSAPREDDSSARPARGRGSDDAGEERPARRRGGEDAGEERPARRRGGRGRSRSAARDDDAPQGGEEKVTEGVVELLDNGSAFLRVSPPEASDDDVYVSAAQVRRCELVSGDAVAGPVRPARRSERYPSLVRVDTINGAPADQVAEGTPFDELAATFPTERFALGSEDATLKAIEWLTPIGRGSRVSIVGSARAGKTEALQRLAGALAGQDGLEVTLVHAGVRPEELAQAPDGVTVAGAVSFGASPDARGHAVERAIDTARRVAARGGDAIVLVDTLDGLPPGGARKALAAARNLAEGGSLTVIATASEPVGGETTVIALDVALTSTGRLPALDLVASGTLRAELLVGEAGAEAIAQARAAAQGEE